MMKESIINVLRAIVGKRHVLTEREDRVVYSMVATAFSHLPEAEMQPANRDQVVEVVKVAAPGKMFFYEGEIAVAPAVPENSPVDGVTRSFLLAMP